MPSAMQAAIWSGGQQPYVDLNFATNTYKASTFQSSSLTNLQGFTFTRASLATMFDATGKLTYGPNNLCLRSEAFDNATWGKTNVTVSADAAVAPDGTTTADAIVLGAGTLIKYVSQSIAGPLGSASVVVLSVYAKAGTHSFVQLINAGANSYYANFDVSTGTVGNVGANTTATISSAGNGWYRCSIYLNGAVSYNAISFIQGVTSNTSGYNASTTSTGTFYLWGAQLEAVTYATTPSTYYPTTTAAYYGPRLVYDPVTLASLGILVEEARTNYLVQSNTFSTTWTNGNITLTAGSITGPDGTASGWKFQNTATASTSFYQSAVFTGTAATASVYVKVGTTTTNAFVLRNVTTATDLISGTLTWATPSMSGAGWSITAVGNGWYRVIGTASTGITSGDTLRFYIGHAGSSATAGEYFYAYQAQLE